MTLRAKELGLEGLRLFNASSTCAITYSICAPAEPGFTPRFVAST